MYHVARTPTSLAPQPPTVPTARQASAVANQLQHVCNSSALATTDRRRPLADPPRADIDHKRSRPAFPESAPRLIGWGHRSFETQIYAYKNGHINSDPVLKTATILLLDENDLEKSKQLFQQLKAKLQEVVLQPDAYLFNVMITKCARAGETNEAMALLEEMQAQVPPCAPTIAVFNAVMSGFVKTPDWAGIEKVLRIMEKQEVPPNCITYGMLMDANATARNGERAEALLRKMARSAQRDPSLRPNGAIWASAINAYANESDGPNAEKLLREMQAQDPPVGSGEAIWGAAIKAYANKNDGTNAERLFREMQAQDPPVTPGVIHYHMVIQAHANAGHCQAAEEWFWNMQEQDPPVFPDCIAVRTMMKVYADDGRWGGAEKLLGDMKRWAQRDRSLGNDKHIWNSAIKAWVKGDRADRAARVIRTMRDQNRPVTADFVHYNLVISALEEKGRIHDASGVIEDAVAAGVFARNAGYNRRQDKLDFHLGAILKTHDASDGRGVPARVAVALLHYHRGNITRRTEFVVGRRGGDRIKDAVLEALHRQGKRYIVSPDNPGRLIPR